MTQQYSDAVPGGTLPQQWFTADDAAQLGRLGRFRASHADVSIRQAEYNAGWEAVATLPGGDLGCYAPRPLGILLDVLEEDLDAFRDEVDDADP